LAIFNSFCSNFTFYFSKNNVGVSGVIMASVDWKDRQYKAHYRLSKKRGWDFSDNNPYFERMCIVLPNPKIKTKQQMKEELKKNGYK
jgi:hypothetical protein